MSSSWTGAAAEGAAAALRLSAVASAFWQATSPDLAKHCCRRSMQLELEYPLFRPLTRTTERRRLAPSTSMTARPSAYHPELTKAPSAVTKRRRIELEAASCTQVSTMPALVCWSARQEMEAQAPVPCMIRAAPSHPKCCTFLKKSCFASQVCAGVCLLGLCWLER